MGFGEGAGQLLQEAVALYLEKGKGESLSEGEGMIVVIQRTLGGVHAGLEGESREVQGVGTRGLQKAHRKWK